MAHVITEPCIKCMTCVDNCPVQAIATNDDSERCCINPDECIDCGNCMQVCPVEAIFPEDDVPADWKDYIAKNAEFFK